MNNEAMDSAQQTFGDGGPQVDRKLQLVRAGAFQCGIFADQIATIVRWRQPIPLPHAPKSVLGIVTLQGRMLTVLDLALLSTAAPSSSETVFSKEPGDVHLHLIALRGDEQLALAVAEVGGAIEIGNGDFAENIETAGTLILGVLHNEGVDVQILNPDELFSTAIQGRERRRRRF